LHSGGLGEEVDVGSGTAVLGGTGLGDGVEGGAGLGDGGLMRRRARGRRGGRRWARVRRSWAAPGSGTAWREEPGSGTAVLGGAGLGDGVEGGGGCRRGRILSGPGGGSGVEEVNAAARTRSTAARRRSGEEDVRWPWSVRLDLRGRRRRQR
jgi:hypothetical protein